MQVLVREARVTEILDLRHRILRHGLARTAAEFQGDELETTHHVAALADDHVVGCATILLSSWQGEAAWQLRGMAVDDDYQARGVGRLLVAELEKIARDSSRQLMWCNARTPAIGFYEKLGWKVMSGVFDVPTAGPHVKMLKRLSPP